MIGYIEGEVLEHSANWCLIKTQGGIGFRIYVPAHTIASIPKKGERMQLYTSFIVREDAQELFGFQTFEEQQTFDLLITISKVGAKTALAILSVFRPKDLQKIALGDDAFVLAQVPGIGKKTAQHVFLELKDKLKDKLKGLPAAEVQSTGAAPSILRNVLDGLTNLGYAQTESYPVVSKILADNPEMTVENALRSALQALARGKK